MESKLDLQCYSETAQESVSASTDNLPHLPSPSVDPKPKSSHYLSELVPVSESAKQIHRHQSNSSSPLQSDCSNSLFRAPQVKQSEKK